MAKVVLVDNLNRETIADVLLEGNLTDDEAERKADEYNKSHGPNPSYWARKVDDEYRLWGGMAEFV